MKALDADGGMFGGGKGAADGLPFPFDSDNFKGKDEKGGLGDGEADEDADPLDPKDSQGLKITESEVREAFKEAEGREPTDTEMQEAMKEVS
jgi:hypothetical protein